MKELNDIFFSMTFSGETTGLAASIATIHELMEKPVIEQIWAQGIKLRAGLEKIKQETGLDVDICRQPAAIGLCFQGSQW